LLLLLLLLLLRCKQLVGWTEARLTLLGEAAAHSLLQAAACNLPCAETQVLFLQSTSVCWCLPKVRPGQEARHTMASEFVER
jgi:hypothetical protein